MIRRVLKVRALTMCFAGLVAYVVGCVRSLRTVRFTQTPSLNVTKPDMNMRNS